MNRLETHEWKKGERTRGVDGGKMEKKKSRLINKGAKNVPALRGPF